MLAQFTEKTAKGNCTCGKHKCEVDKFDNTVTALYHDASLGNLVNIVLVRLLILTEEEESLNITHNAKNTLTDFCRWQNDFNDVGDAHPHHHDTALLFTRKDICLDMNQPCATLGLAHVSGMCERHRSCTINEDSGLGMAYTVAHEMGHLFGMDHDGGTQNDCKYPEPGTSQLMASRLDVHFGPMKWSRCSRDYISRFLDRGWGDCLLDEPSPHTFNFPHLPAGVMYSADYQCKLLFKRNSTLCTRSSIQHGICTTLWCQVEHACHSKTTPAAPGTACGQDKWCYNGKCVTIAEPPHPIPGGWGEWGEWSQCSRTCGGGVMIQERHCNNPAPANSGRYCEGKRKNYALCKVQACPKGSTGFRALQCSRYNNKVYQGYLYHWLPVIVPGNECKLSCEAAGYSFAAEKSPMVDDGTPCGERSKDICINGICYRVGCDNRIGSNAVEDICGVCHGDGSSCTQITNGFNNTIRSPGLFRITVIPVAARSISIEEKSESSNYIELQDMNGRSIFNSYGYQREGDYTVDDEISTVTYRIRGSMEKVTIKGPLTKPINIVCNIRTRTPNIEYRYYLPKSINESSSVPTTFEWKRDEWTPCSTTCGNGTQRSIVRCVGMMEGAVDDSYCEGSKPDDKQRSCNEHTCPASWWIGPWQSCSVSCGEGVQKRSVFCIRSLSSDEQMAISDATCIQHGAEAKPATALTCSNYACPSEMDWRVGNWSECSSSCGEGTQQRDVECERPDNRCAHEYRPAAEQACTTDCQYYFYSSIEEEYSLDNDYNPTMSSALYSADYTYQGVQRNTFGGWESEEARKKDRRSEILRERKEEKNRQKSVTENNEVSIDSEAFMREDARIDTERHIVNSQRTGLHDSNTFILKEWRSGAWSQCSVTCGSGSRTRSVFCVNSVTSTPLAGCSPDNRPSAVETCQLTVCPPTDPDCADKLDILYCRIAKDSDRCSLPAFMKVCCATCVGR
ncbi:putative A disintegrin and metalloproteinase with thrombospondin motifs 7 [Apostichopus japonicus]|uniref:Putative A disintegrin and metalloproteinase with thrombospondin motifs 7 n=1 Tax=Stichopus japonicus TaxID=307972 RepID=A0A2G8KRE7_STIJA|nr:putative A disintegrin and metalloproteinase with thrombospondin motifs 7 [Apostichopus japonicus]